jgi:gliding motility-associated-like protein
MLLKGWLEGCYNYNSVNIELEDCPTELIMPNVFTPNNDQVNDFFRPIKFEGVVSCGITILNRFGVEIFSSNSINNYWDGKIGGTNGSNRNILLLHPIYFQKWC